MWFKNGDVQVHQLQHHLAYSHLFLEPFAIAMHRCLPPVHPVFKLLREHLHYAIAINIIGRQTLTCEVNSYIYIPLHLLMYGYFALHISRLINYQIHFNLGWSGGSYFERGARISSHVQITKEKFCKPFFWYILWFSIQHWASWGFRHSKLLLSRRWS